MYDVGKDIQPIKAASGTVVCMYICIWNVMCRVWRSSSVIGSENGAKSSEFAPI